MAGYQLVQRIRRLEQELDRLGLVMTAASQYYRDYGDVLAVRAGHNDADGRDTAYSCGDMIREHFGVQE